MMCYRDMTFCSFYKECAKKDCYRALTEDVETRAKQFDLWICQFVNHPKCFKVKEKTDK